MVATIQIPAWLAGEYPFAPKSLVTASGARMSYVDEGPRRDEAVLMVHGNPTWSFYYRKLVAALAPTMRWRQWRRRWRRRRLRAGLRGRA